MPVEFKCDMGPLPIFQLPEKNLLRKWVKPNINWGYYNWRFALLDGFLHIFSKNAIKKCLVSCFLNAGDFL